MRRSYEKVESLCVLVVNAVCVLMGVRDDSQNCLTPSRVRVVLADYQSLQRHSLPSIELHQQTKVLHIDDSIHGCQMRCQHQPVGILMV